ncbi:MAG TPA: hypothetical protein VE684_00590 [Crenalkalicoccus sp.]|jgi:hypothetical protein|nr:hypothetical protein [Crenalkalicoccus sp.]
MDETASQRPQGKQGPEDEAVGDRAFELWLQRGLHDLYDSVAREPVPEELLRMIEEDRARRRS